MLLHYGFRWQQYENIDFMNRLLLLFFIFFISIYDISAKNKWKKLPTSINAVRIIGGRSIHDFWVLDTAKSIIHYTDSIEEIYKTNDFTNITNIRSLRGFYFNNNKVFVFITSNNWITHIASIDNGVIKKYKYTTNGPLKFIGFVDNHYYAFGDFGLIAKFENGDWHSVNSPIEESFNTVISDGKEKLFLNIRNNGVWSFDGYNFNHYNIPNKDNRLNYNIKLFNDSIYVINYQKQIFCLHNDTFVYVLDCNNRIFYPERYLGSNEVGIYDSNGHLISIPLYLKPAQYKVLGDNSILVLSKNGYLYHNYSVKYNFFRDYASTMGVEGIKYSSPLFLGDAKFNVKNTNIVLSDLNGDDKTDILIFDGFSFVDKYIYTNTESGVFINNTEELGINDYPFDGVLLSSIDLNQDYIPELITTLSKKKNQYSVLQKSNKVYHINSTIDIPKKYLTNKSVYNCYTDIDKDGDIDILSSFGYSTKGKGSAIIFHNNGYGDFSEADTSLSSMLNGWNVSTLVADFNNDGLNDILLCKSWGFDKIFFQKEDSRWEEYILDKDDTSVYAQRKSGNIAFDYDNDGDLDIFSTVFNTGISVFENNGKGEFTNITKKLGLDSIVKKGNYHINSADFNNDGYQDIILNNPYLDNNIFLLLNDSLGHFSNHSQEMGIPSGSMGLISISDIDNDGDIDFYVISDGYNKLWINNLDDNNYLKIKLKGVKSNSVGLGAKVWIYESGHINDNKFLKAYKQLGSKEFGLNNQNDLIMHFGLNSSKIYDIKVEFYGGDTKKLFNIKTGQTLTIIELNGLLAFYYSIDNKVYQLLENTVFLTYFGVVILGLFGLFFSIYYGNKLFDWNVRLTSTIITLDIILFTSLLLALYDIDSIYRYIIPLGSALLGSLGPLGVFIWIHKYNNFQTEKDIDYKLFNALRNFSHGEWAASNLNSLQLLFENLSKEDLADNDYLHPFNKRKNTFFELTHPVIEEIIELSSKILVTKEASGEIKKHLSIISENLSKEINKSTLTNKDSISKSIIKLRENISFLKKIIFANHSCSPLKVYKNISEIIENKANDNNIKFDFKSFLEDHDLALMDAASLANIIDNCVGNSIKAMTKVTDKELVIKLIKDDLRYFISISDNGCGIDIDKQELIFENGYSTSSSTGFGLFYAKETLSKYGGRIYVKSSKPWVKTIFMIELQKNTNKTK